MTKKIDIKLQTLMAARDFGINSILLRNAMSKELGMNLTESMCLTLLGIKAVSTPKELARYTGLTTGATTTMLDRLEQKNIIVRKPNPHDRRGVLIEIHESYAARAVSLVVGIQQAHQDLINSYTEAELQVITDFLTRFSNNMVEHTRKIEES